MAEYITKEQTLEAFVEWTNSREDYAEHPVWFARNIGSIKSVDVIERSEYELIHRQLAQAFDRIAELDKLNGELHSKIDKAIEEITNLNRYQKGIDTMNVGDDLMISWCKTLDILKEI